jgi:hypothetical protein
MSFSQSVILGDQVVSLFLWWAGKDCDDIDTQKITLKSLLNQPHAKELDFFILMLGVLYRKPSTTNGRLLFPVYHDTHV